MNDQTKTPPANDVARLRVALYKIAEVVGLDPVGGLPDHELAELLAARVRGWDLKSMPQLPEGDAGVFTISAANPVVAS